MRSTWLACFLLSALAYGQATAPANPTPPQAAGPQEGPKAAVPAEVKPAEPAVGPNDPVITLKGFCPGTNQQGDACQTVVTREQFEKLANALQPNMSPMVRRQLATVYSRMLMMSTAAEQRGLDKTPKFDEMTRFLRMQILSQELTRALQEESQKISDADVEKYYQDNAANYEEAVLQRIFVPRTKQVTPPKVTAATKDKAAKEAAEKEREALQKAAEATMKRTATALQARAAKGEDFDKLEKEAYTLAGLKGTPPSTKMEKIRRTTLLPTHKSVMDLKPGQVSETISDASGHYIYKMVSKKTLPLDSVKTEIKNFLGGQRFRDAMQAYQQAAPALNEAYFGPVRPPISPMQPGKPPAQRQENEPDPD